MPQLNRREFAGLFASSLALAAGPGRKNKLRIGVTDWNLRLGADPEAVTMASQLGFDGVQVFFGRKIVDGKMPADRSDIIARYLSLSKQFGTPIDGTCVDRLHDNGLKSDKEAPKWVADGIRLTKELNAKILLVPFFGPWALNTPAERDYTADALRELAPEAQKAGVILGLEDTISAEDNVRIIEKVGSRHVLVYYDVGNSTNNGFDVVKEIRWLGKDRICQIHLKDNPHYLGEGNIEFVPILHAIRDIEFTGYANLETDAHPEAVEADMRRNLLYIRKVMQEA